MEGVQWGGKGFALLLDHMLEGTLRKAVIGNNKAEDQFIEVIRKGRMFEEHVVEFAKWRGRNYGGGKLEKTTGIEEEDNG